MCLSLDTDMSDDEIKESIQNMIPICTIKSQGFCLSINGYDEDHRELWQIPEALGFMRRLCDFGFLSVLETSTTCPDLINKQYKVDNLPGFGALEVWMCATNRLEKGKNDIDRETMNKFHEALGVSNRRAEEIMKEPPYQTGIQKFASRTQVPDAPIKHHGYNKDRGKPR